MYKEDMALNNLQWLIRHKTQPNQIKPNQSKLHIKSDHKRTFLIKIYLKVRKKSVQHHSLYNTSGSYITNR